MLELTSDHAGAASRAAVSDHVELPLARGSLRVLERDGIRVGPGEACGATLRFFEEN